MRAKLQSKGTRSSQKRLKTISGGERRFKAWANHNISKTIVNNCNAGTIVLENIKGIRKQRLGKRFNFWNGWNFYQLQNFIEYKALQKGIRTIKVSPCHTSQTCSHCGYSLNADLNASFNLAKHHSKATQCKTPRVFLFTIIPK